MLYTKKEIENFDNNSHVTAVSRYLHKIEKKETKKLLPHECEFICSFLPYIFADQQLVDPVHKIYELDLLYLSRHGVKGFTYLNRNYVTREKSIPEGVQTDEC